ncbi:MAG: hypothetical protein V1644_02430 [Candidatus Micrarchaeota archaeon]
MEFRQRRGQAFETMMLVISVIVALAILGVLLNILGGVGGLFNPTNPVKSIQTELSRIGGQYSPGEAPIEVKLEKRRMDTTQVTQDNANILPSDLIFIVHDSLSDSVEVGGNGEYITANKEVQAFVVACGGGSDNKYVIAFGRKGKESEIADLCRSTANINN